MSNYGTWTFLPGPASDNTIDLDTSFDFGANEPPGPSKCLMCSRELSETLDAYYGTNETMKLVCEPCRRTI